jgi:hypothetical protein
MPLLVSFQSFSTRRWILEHCQLAAVLLLESLLNPIPQFIADDPKVGRWNSQVFRYRVRTRYYLASSWVPSL